METSRAERIWNVIDRILIIIWIASIPIGLASLLLDPPRPRCPCEKAPQASYTMEKTKPEKQNP
jgi:hypothetical protein